MMRLIATIILFAAVTMTARAQESQYLTILHLNDTHSNLLPGTPRDANGNALEGGAARAATVIAQQRAENENVIVLHAGDAFIGDPMYNIPAALNQEVPELAVLDMPPFSLDAMVCGNHEFDFGIDALYAVLMNMNPSFPLLSANMVTQSPYDAMYAPYIKKSTVIDRGIFRIGVIGVTTPYTNRSLTLPGPVYFAGVNETEMATLMQEIATEAGKLRMVDGCNVIILLSHNGMALDKLFAQNVPGIDVIVGGHDHIATKSTLKVKNQYTNEFVHIVQTEGFFRQIGSLELRLHNNNLHVQHYSLIDLDASVPEHPVISQVVTGVQQQIDAATAPLLPISLFTTQIGYCDGFFTELATSLTQPGNHDTHVGNLVADAFRSLPGVEIGLEPSGSTAQPLFAGPITTLDVYRMIGYGADNTNPLGYPVMILTMSGASIAAGIEAALSEIEVDDEMLLQVSGNLQYFYDPHAPVGERLKGILYNGSPLDMSTNYTVATNALIVWYLDYLGVPYLSAVPLMDPSNTRTISEFEVVTEYIVTGLGGMLNASKLPGRVQAISSATLPFGHTIPSMAKLNSNQPNPFLGETAVSFTMEEAAPVTLKVFDMAGREVATLQQGYAQTGTHTVMFEANSLPAGMYFCRLLTPDGMVQTLKMLKIR